MKKSYEDRDIVPERIVCAANIDRETGEVILVGLPLIVLTSIVLIEKCYSAYYSLGYTLKLRKEEDDKK